MNPAIISLLEKWQTLVAASLAFLGAAWTVKTIERQIFDAQDARKLENQRHIAQAEARLAIALNYIMRHIQDHIVGLFRELGYSSKHEMAKTLRNLKNWKLTKNEVRTKCKRPDQRFYDDTLDALSCADNKLSIETSRLIKTIEIVLARQELGSSYNDFDRLIDVLRVYMQSERIIEYIYERVWENDPKKLSDRFKNKIKNRFNFSLDELDEAQSSKLARIGKNGHYGIVD